LQFPWSRLFCSSLGLGYLSYSTGANLESELRAAIFLVLLDRNNGDQEIPFLQFLRCHAEHVYIVIYK
jgi:hypothetical protein